MFLTDFLKDISCFSDYYKYKTHAQTNKMLIVSFKTFLKHKQAQ